MSLRVSAPLGLGALVKNQQRTSFFRDAELTLVNVKFFLTTCKYLFELNLGKFSFSSRLLFLDL